MRLQRSLTTGWYELLWDASILHYPRLRQIDISPPIILSLISTRFMFLCVLDRQTPLPGCWCYTKTSTDGMNVTPTLALQTGDDILIPRKTFPFGFIRSEDLFYCRPRQRALSICSLVSLQPENVIRARILLSFHLIGDLEAD